MHLICWNSIIWIHFWKNIAILVLFTSWWVILFVHYILTSVWQFCWRNSTTCRSCETITLLMKSRSFLWLLHLGIFCSPAFRQVIVWILRIFLFFVWVFCDITLTSLVTSTFNHFLRWAVILSFITYPMTFCSSWRCIINRFSSRNLIHCHSCVSI